jgi:cell division septum initiation protein DivIVA
MAEGQIIVDRKEYEAEKEHIEELEARIRELEDRYNVFVASHPGRMVVPPEEYAREVEHISRLEDRLREAWSRWGFYMWSRRSTLEAGLEKAAAAYLGLIREAREEIRRLWGRISRARAELDRKIIWPPEMAALISELEKLRAELQAELERFRRKIIGNKLIALHKRWFYESPRKGHDISIEGFVSMVIPSDEEKEDYEKLLIDTLEEHMFSQPNFERLTELDEKVEGFEEKLVDEPVRPPRVETLEWWHEVFTEPQLSLKEFMEEY